jgi:mediator of RNA polymerase II transcription subunit 31
MSGEVASNERGVGAGGIHWGHQEVDRIIDEVEQIYKSSMQEWLVVEPIGSMIMHEMYEDEDDMEDAVGGSFEAFLRAMPHVDLRVNERGASEFRMHQPDASSSCRTLTLRVASREDLWRVLFKAPDATLRIPHLEFEAGRSVKRVIDSVYNHIAAAVFNLSSHVRQNAQMLDSGTAERIAETVDQLNQLLDVEEPFDLVVDDPTAMSLFKPSDGVAVVSEADQRAEQAQDPGAALADDMD